MNKDNIARIFGKAFVKRLEAKECPLCCQPIDADAFRDKTSVQECEISGMCQSCQDKVFSNED